MQPELGETFQTSTVAVCCIWGQTFPEWGSSRTELLTNTYGINSNTQSKCPFTMQQDNATSTMMGTSMWFDGSSLFNLHLFRFQALTTSHEAIVLNEVTAGIQGWAWFRNIGTDTSTHIKVGINNADSSFTEVFNLKGGEFAIMRLGGTALYAESSTGTLHLQYSIIEE